MSHIASIHTFLSDYKNTLRQWLTSLLEAIPLLASPPFGAIDSIGTIRTLIECCYSEDNPGRFSIASPERMQLCTCDILEKHLF